MSERKLKLETEQENPLKGFPWTHPVLQNHIVFIGGLSGHTKIRTIRKYIAGFGKIIWIKVFSNRLGMGEGNYCHLILSHASGYQALFEQATHEIDASQVRIKMWKATKGISSYDDKLKRRKLFVKNLSLHHSCEALTAFFSRFGTIDQIELAPASPGKHHKRFCFVIFKDPASVGRCLEQKKSIYYETRMRCRSYEEEKQPILQGSPSNVNLAHCVQGQTEDPESQGELSGGLALGSLPREVKNHRKLIRGLHNNANQQQFRHQINPPDRSLPESQEAGERQEKLQCDSPDQHRCAEQFNSSYFIPSGGPHNPRRNSAAGLVRVKVQHSTNHQVEPAMDCSGTIDQMRHLGVRVQYYTIIGGM